LTDAKKENQAESLILFQRSEFGDVTLVLLTTDPTIKAKRTQKQETNKTDFEISSISKVSRFTFFLGLRMKDIK